MNHRRIARRGAGVVAPALVVGLLAGCTQELPVPEAQPAVVGAAVTEDQEKTIITRVSEAIDKATEARETDKLGERMTGPAKELRASEIKVAKKVGNGDEITDLPMTVQAVVLPSETTWPRTSFAVSTPPKDMTRPALYAFTQESPRADYKLWGWVMLLSGITMPQFASTDVGSEEIAPDDDKTLKMAPEAAVTAYADVLSEDKNSKHAEKFQDDEFRSLMRKHEKAQTKGDSWKEAEGKYSFSAKKAKDSEVLSMRTVDGGAIVMADIRSSQLLEIQEGGCVPPAKSFQSQKALFGDQDVTNALRTEYISPVALQIPPKGSDEKVRLVGFDYIAVAATSEGEEADCD